MKILTNIKYCLPFAIFFYGTQVYANPSNCYSIQNSDQKNYCLALAKNQKSYCYSIQENEKKNLCLAQSSNQRSYCYSIRSNDTKNQCLSIVRWLRIYDWCKDWTTHWIRCHSSRTHHSYCLSLEIQEGQQANTEAKHSNFRCVLCAFCPPRFVLTMNTPTPCFCYSFFDAKIPHFSIESVTYIDFWPLFCYTSCIVVEFIVPPTNRL